MSKPYALRKWKFMLLPVAIALAALLIAQPNARAMTNARPILATFFQNEAPAPPPPPASVPETGSTLGLLSLALITLIGVRWFRRSA